MNDKPAVIFDFGGVLITWDPRRLYRQYFDGREADMERFFEEINFNQWNLGMDAGRPFAEAVDSHCRLYPHYADLIRAFDTRWEETVAGPIQDSIELLEEISRQEYPLYGLSNWSVEKFSLVKPRHSFFRHFRDIILSGEEGLAKPDPRLFQVALDRIQRPAPDCVLIDDSAANIQTANEMGFQTIHFQSPEQARRELLALGIGN